ncbi:hypothetical protein ACHAQH_005716 [Verticillium albo-atrum]
MTMAQPGVKDAPSHKRVTSAELAQRLRQSERAGERSTAIPTFGKYLRRGDRFQPTWDAIGGAMGLADLMAEFSVRDVRFVCQRLGRTATAINARAERRAVMGELVAILYSNTNPDTRPLQSFYQTIIPACEPRVVQEWESKVNWTFRQQRSLFLAHRQQYEMKVLEDIFSPNADSTFADIKKLVNGNMPFCRAILETLEAADENARIPNDTVNLLIMPVLKRLLHRRYGDETRDNWLGLVVRCFQAHANQFKTNLSIDANGLIRYTIQRWTDTRRDQRVLGTYLQQLLSLRDAGRGNTLNMIHTALNVPKRLKPSGRYQLLQLMFQHMQEFQHDLEDGSPEGLAKLKAASSITNLWPTHLLLSIDKTKAFDLFERLEKVNPGRSFLGRPSRQSILQQTNSPGEVGGDVEVLRAMLSRALPDREPRWLDRVKEVAQQRKKKATESREPEARAFWAKSTFNLCVAAGDLELLLETTHWARRFNKDSLTTFELYNKGALTTVELTDLLCAIPKHEDDEPAPAVTLDMVKRDINLANQIMITLTQTAIMAVSEPGFQRNRWSDLLRLPKAVSDQRLASLNPFKAITEAFDAADMTAIVWKPTIDTLLRLEAMLRSPSAQALLGPSTQIEAPAVNILWKLPYATAVVQADLIDFFIKAIVIHQGPEALKAQIGNIVGVVLRLAHSDQPSLASPFIRDIIKNGDDSSWHRRVLNKGFMQSLPAAAARDFIQSMADGMHELMKEQNARPWVEGQAPVIKVTTVKMIAQVLEGNLFLDPATSCSILVTLLTEARHIDARITIISSLLTTMMEPTCSPSLQIQILEALETRVVPIAAQLSERRPTTEEDWQAETLPDVSDETPILNILISKANAMPSGNENRTRLVQIVMSILEQSAMNNKRWIQAFLEKNDFRLDPGESLPVGPVSFRTLASIFADWTASMPLSLFNMFRETVLVNMAPSPGIERITKTVKWDGKLVSSNAGKHWVAQFDGQRQAFDNGLTKAIVVLLGRESPAGGEVTIPMVQQFVLAAAERLVRRGDSVYPLVEKFGIHRACSTRADWQAWKTNCVPVIQDLITKVEDMRGQRLHGILPSTFRLRIHLLRMPSASSKEPSVASEIDAFVSKVSGLVDYLAARRLPYHDDFWLLKDTVMRISGHLEPLGIAVKLGRLEGVMRLEEPPLSAYLQMELVLGLLESAERAPSEEVAQDARSLVLGFKKCDAERLRELGVQVEEKLRKQGGKGWYLKAQHNK